MRPLERLHTALIRVRELFGSARISAELDQELRFHLEQETAHNIAQGMSPDEARRRARLDFGGVERFREETRDARGFAALEALGRETRLALRRLKRAPAFTAGVTGTLAIGLGAATGIGALVYGVMLRPLPYPEPDRLVRIDFSTPGLGVNTAEHSSGTFVYFQERAQSFAALGAYLENEGVAITEGDAPERVTGAIVTTNVFSILGTRPALGRLFREEDARQDPVPVLISHDLWQGRFGGDSAVVGRSIELNRSRRLILGVLPKGYDFPSRAAALYYPERVEATRADLAQRYLTVIGRLKPGVTVGEAQSELTLLVGQLHERFPELSPEAVRTSGLHPVVRTLRGAIAEPVRGELTLLALMVGVILLMTTASVATLYLLRAERARGEVAVSRALGAGRGAEVRRFVVEGVAVGLAGGFFAVPLAALAVTTRFGFRPGQIPRLHDVELSGLILTILVGTAGLVGALLGAAAAARAGTRDTPHTLPGTARATGGRGWRRVQEGLVAVQVALALTLLLGAALTGQSLARLRQVDLGITPPDRTKFSLVLPFRGYPTYQRAAAFHLTVLQSLRATPGVTAAAVAMQFPLTPQLLSTHPRLEAVREGELVEVVATANVISPDFFRVMGIPLRAGRTFAEGDLVHPTPGVVLSGSLARRLFGAVDPMGRELRIAGSRRYPAYRVVGVSGDVFADRIADGPLQVIYFPLLDDLAPASSDTAGIPFVPAGMHFVVVSELPLATLGPAFRSIVAGIDPRVPVWDVRSVETIVSDATARARLTTLLLAIAAAATLLLGAVGLYSVVTYAVAGRAPEFAVRLALGATPRGISYLVFRDGALIALAGTLAGLAAGVAGARVLRGVLYQVSPTSPVAYAVAAALVLVTVFAAMYGPARRAGQADPARVLRASGDTGLI